MEGVLEVICWLQVEKKFALEVKALVRQKWLIGYAAGQVRAIMPLGHLSCSQFQLCSKLLVTVSSPQIWTFSELYQMWIELAGCMSLAQPLSILSDS
jgi:hypothetical protein